MPLFQKNVLKDYLKKQDAKSVAKAYKIFSGYFHNPHTQQNIHSSKEEQFQATFLSWLFAEVLGYTLFPNPGHNLTTEFKNEKGAQKADGAILKSLAGDGLSPSGGGAEVRGGGGLSSAGGGAEERGGGGLSGTRAAHKGGQTQKALAVIEQRPGQHPQTGFLSELLCCSLLARLKSFSKA